MPCGHRARARQRPPPLLGVALVLLSGCLDPIGPGTLTPGKGLVYGHVRRWCGTQDPLPGAEISVDGKVRARTDDLGAYRVEVSPGRPHTMAADVTGYVHAETVVTVPAGGEREQRFGLQALGDLGTTPELDVLFVIDNSAGMGPWQDALVAAFAETLAPILEGSTGSSIDVHLGFVSTDMGVPGQYAIPGCMSGDEGGALQLQPRGDAGACKRSGLLSDRYLWYQRDAAGSSANFGSFPYSPGDLADAFTCYAPLGTSGCRFPMPLEAMKQGIDPGNPKNNVFFLRDLATLLIVIVTDRDDCSAPAKSDLFDPFQTDVSSVLGPFTTYRCFEFGVTCGGEPPGRTTGARSDCQPGDPDPTYALLPVDDYIDILNGCPLGGCAVVTGRRAILGVIAGAATPVKVALDSDDYARLQPSCLLKKGSSVGADPAIRLNYVATKLPTTNSICGDDGSGWSGFLATLGDQALAQAVAARKCAP